MLYFKTALKKHYENGQFLPHNYPTLYPTIFPTIYSVAIKNIQKYTILRRLCIKSCIMAGDKWFEHPNDGVRGFYRYSKTGNFERFFAQNCPFYVFTPQFTPHISPQINPSFNRFKTTNILKGEIFDMAPYFCHQK